MLSPFRLYEVMPVLIMKYLGLSEIRIGDIECLSDRCIYNGTDYLKLLNISIVMYTLLYLSDQLPNDGCYAFFSEPGKAKPDVHANDSVYDNTYVISCGKAFKSTDEWLRRPLMLNAALDMIM